MPPPVPEKKGGGELGGLIHPCSVPSSKQEFYPGNFITQSLHLNIHVQEVTTNQNILGAIIKSMINARIPITILGSDDYFA